MKLLLTLSLLFGSSMAHAYMADNDRQVEIGAVVGYPVMAGLTVGYWGPTDMPVVARLSTGVGTTLDLGWGFSKDDEEVRAYIGLTGGVYGYLGVLPQTQWFLGPSVGMRWRKLFVALGPSIRFESGLDARLIAMGQLGFSGLF